MTAPKPRRRSLRFAIVAVVSLLLGAATTVAVAWGCSQRDMSKATMVDSAVRSRLPTEGPGGGCIGILVYGLRGATVWDAVAVPKTLVPDNPNGLSPEELAPRDIRRMIMPWLDGKSPLPSDMYHARAGQFGWPVPSLGCWLANYYEPESYSGLLEIRSLRKSVRNAPPGLPIRPLLPGFAVDTALYALSWYLLIFTPLPLIRAGRRRFRVSRGMCGSCGYDLKGTSGRPCPECGA